MSRSEAALNLWREERRVVKDTRWAILSDHELARTDPGHRNDLLAQTQAEQGQLTAAIDLLSQVEAGAVRVVDAASAAGSPEPAPEAAGIDPRPVRAQGLIKRFTPEGRA